MNCRTVFNGTKIDAAARKGAVVGLYRSAAFLMKSARQKIRYRKKTTSRPGQPPFQHGKGRNSFRHSIRFAVDKTNLTAYIGPQKQAGRKGRNVPRILEFGGFADATPNPGWYQVRGVPKGMNSKAAVAAWLLSEGYGPLFMAASESAVVNQYFSHRKSKYSRSQIAASKKKNPDQWIFQNIQKRKNQNTKKNIFYISLPLKTQKQAEQTAENIIRFYGFPQIKKHYVAARPFMGPSLRDSKSQLAKHFAKTI